MHKTMNSILVLCSTDNKTEKDIRVQDEDQKSKASKLLESSYLYEIFKLKESEFLSPPILYSSLVLGLKLYTTIQPLWLTSVVAGIKDVCHHCLDCMVD